MVVGTKAGPHHPTRLAEGLVDADVAVPRITTSFEKAFVQHLKDQNKVSGRWKKKCGKELTIWG